MDQRITVLIPNYNGGRFLPDLFNALQCQTYKRFRVVLLDDGSTDDSVEIAKKYQASLANLEVLPLENVGMAANWNRGIGRVDTEFFAMLHCDDSYESGYLEAMVNLMDEYPLAAIGHCMARTINTASAEFFSPVEQYKNSVFFPDDQFCRSITEEYKCLMRGSYINCPAVIYRTGRVRQIGIFNESLKQTLDWEYWFRVLLKGYQICGLRQPLYRYRRHEDNATVRNSKDLQRYQEELATMLWAHEEGKKHGLVDGSPDLKILERIVIFDLASVLEQGNKESAKSKLRFLSQELRTRWPVLMVLQCSIWVGKFGGWLMTTVINALVRGLGWISVLKRRAAH